MGLRIKEVCKAKGMTMVQIAEKLGITPISLSQCLSGNPTLSRLNEIADVLGVDVSDLFERKSADVYGCLYVNGKPRIINGKQDIEALLLEI